MKEEFLKYTEQFTDCKDIQRKIQHSLRVADIMRNLAISLGTVDTEVAYKLGLLHDIGRFNEFALHQKYVNNDFDHGKNGVTVLEEGNYYRVHDIPETVITPFLEAIYYHNKFELPKTVQGNEYAKLIRDADKTDLLYLRGLDSLWELQYPKGGISPSVLADFNAERCINHRDIKTTSDCILSYLAFVYDINYEESLSAIQKNGYIQTIFNNIDEPGELKESFKKINDYIERRLNNVRK